MTELPIAPVVRLMKQSGADRISSDAGAALIELMEKYAESLTREAGKLASHAGRKTVTAYDIRMAADLLR
ncbi:MAG: histone family protein [Methanoregulaceae archaeon]|jgi:histone H3/H4|nr:histone family protein [Methanoregulaceae archaeon]